MKTYWSTTELKQLDWVQATAVAFAGVLLTGRPTVDVNHLRVVG
jgi:hypothetical protein